MSETLREHNFPNYCETATDTKYIYLLITFRNTNFSFQLSGPGPGLMEPDTRTEIIRHGDSGEREETNSVGAAEPSQVGSIRKTPSSGT